MKYLLALLPILLLVDAAPADCNARPGRRPRPSGWRHKGRPSASVAPVPSVKGEAAVPPSAVTTTTIADSDTTAVPQPAENTPAPAPQPEPIVAGENAPGNAANANAQPRSSSKSTTKAAAPAQTSAAAAAPAPAPVSGVSPVGLAINYVSKPNVASFGGNIGWYYSWNLDTLPNTGGLEFVPMVHGADMANSFSGNVPAGTKNILGFNERECTHGFKLTYSGHRPREWWIRYRPCPGGRFAQEMDSQSTCWNQNRIPCGSSRRKDMDGRKYYSRFC